MLRHPGTWIVLTLLVIVPPSWSAGEPPQPAPAPPAAPAADDNARFIHAAINGDVATVRELLDRGVKPDEPKDKYGNNPIQMATHNHHFEVVKLLAEKGANVTNGVIKYASYDRNTEIVVFLIEKGAGQTPKELVAHKVPLVFYTQIPAFRKLLIEKTITDKDLKFKGRTILIDGVEQGMTDVVKALIAKGADVNLKTDDGLTPLGAALKNQEKAGEIVELLRKAGAKE